jgi:hypothetical protein
VLICVAKVEKVFGRSEVAAVVCYGPALPVDKGRSMVMGWGDVCQEQFSFTFDRITFYRCLHLSLENESRFERHPKMHRKSETSLVKTPRESLRFPFHSLLGRTLRYPTTLLIIFESLQHSQNS